MNSKGFITRVAPLTAHQISNTYYNLMRNVNDDTGSNIHINSLSDMWHKMNINDLITS